MAKAKVTDGSFKGVVGEVLEKGVIEVGKEKYEGYKLRLPVWEGFSVIAIMPYSKVKEINEKSA